MSTVDERPSPRVRPELKLYRPPLTTVQAMEQVIARDMEGDPDWQLTGAARQWLATALRTLAPGEGRSR